MPEAEEQMRLEKLKILKTVKIANLTGTCYTTTAAIVCASHFCCHVSAGGGLIWRLLRQQHKLKTHLYLNGLKSTNYKY